MIDCSDGSRWDFDDTQESLLGLQVEEESVALTYESLRPTNSLIAQSPHRNDPAATDLFGPRSAYSRRYLELIAMELSRAQINRVMVIDGTCACCNGWWCWVHSRELGG